MPTSKRLPDPLSKHQGGKMKNETTKNPRNGKKNETRADWTGSNSHARRSIRVQ